MKKFLALIIVIFLLMSTYPFEVCAVGQGIIHQEVHQSDIAKNVVYKNIIKFSDAGWQNIHVLEAKLDNPYTDLELLTPEDGMSAGNTLQQMTNDKQIIAAINGDFFISGDAFSPIGPVIKDEEMYSSPTYRTDELAVFSLNKQNVPVMDYWNWNIILKTDNQEIEISAINKISFDYIYPVVYTQYWGKKAPSVSFEDILYIVIDNNRIKKLVKGANMEVSIPSGGMIVMLKDQTAEKLEQTLQPGDKVKLEIETQPDYSRLKMAVGGGSMLVKDGNIYPFTHNISGYHPRTALGFTKDGKKLIAVTVDGRNESCAGMTQTQLAELMIELGAYNAINLDGGGSSTMLARKLGENDLSVLNYLSNGSQRRLSNGLAIKVSSFKSTLKDIFVETEDQNVFVGTGRTIEVKGYDKNFNPVNIDEKRITWEVSGVEGAFNDNVFYPSTTGTATITSKYMGKTAQIQLQVIAPPVKLILPYKQLRADINEIFSFNVYGKNVQGFSALIESQDLKIEGNIGKIEGQKFFSKDKEGTGYISINFEQLTAKLPVSVGYNRVLLDDFEKSNGSFTAYPSSVSGHYVMDITQNISGRRSGRIYYDFTKTDGTAASYLVLNDKGIPLYTLPDMIGINVFNPNPNNHWLRMLVEDAEGKEITLDLAKKMDWKGFEFVKTRIPSGLKAPIFIKRIYVVETNPIMHDEGMVLLDDLTAMYSYALNEELTTHEETEIADPAKTDIPPDTWAFSFSFFGSTVKNKLLDIHIVNQMKELANSHDQLAVFAGEIEEGTLSGLDVPVIATQPGYGEINYGNNTFIKLDNFSKGLRAYSPQQWYWLKDRLESINEGNLFLVLPNPVWGESGFSDIKEAKLLHKYLLDMYMDRGINVYVLHGGNNGYTYDIRDGIKYIGISGTRSLSKDYSLFDDFNYIRFYIDEKGEITYQLLPIYTI